MSSILIYTFRTFPWMMELESITENIIVLDKLKEDILEVENDLKQNKYTLVLGLAKGRDKSIFETKGVNKFNKGKIIPNGLESYPLYFPQEGYENIKVNGSYTTSFCNWGIYMVSTIIDQNSRDTQHLFLHIQEEDIKSLKKFLRSALSNI